MATKNPLKNISIFSGLGNAELALLEMKASRKRYPADTLVIRQGDLSDSLFVILSGEVRVFVTDFEGNKTNIDRMKAGDYFGEYAVLVGSKRSASVKTVKESDFLIVSKDQILDMFADNPDTAFSLMGDLITRIQELTATQKDLNEMAIQGKIAGYLLSLEQDGEGEQKITLPDLIAAVDLPGNIVKNMVRDMQSAGLVSVKSGYIVVNASP